MKYSVLLAGLLVATMVTAVAAAQESIPSFETVVEDVVFNTSNKVVIDEKTIKESRAPNITSLLSSQANVTVVSTAFQPNSIFIRGGDSSHVMIIVDGVPFYDASTIQRTFNLNSLDIKSVRRIEIIKGGQTVLYGGQALSGVIKIDTIPQEFKTKTGLQVQAGTQNFRDITAVHTEALDETHAFLMRGHGSWKDAMSPVEDSDKSYAQNNWNGDAAYAWKGSVEGHLKTSFLQDLNYSPGSDRTSNRIYDTEGFETYTRQSAATAHLKFNDLAWEPRLALSMQNSLRKYEWPATTPPDMNNPTGTDQRYGANLKTARVDFTPYKGEQLSVNGGLSYIYEDFVYRNKGTETVNKFSEQRGLFLKADYTWTPGFTVAVGGRLENWDDQDAVSTYQLGLTLFERTKLEVASGYKIPSLFQLFSSYGNPDLKTEKATQYSLMQEWAVSERQNLSVTLFYAEFKDLLQITGTFPAMKYNNVSKSKTRGVDITYTMRPFENGTLMATYGYQEPRDVDNDRWLLRRPLVNGSLKYLQTLDRHTGSIELIGAGTRTDYGFQSVPTVNPGYVIANAAYSFAWTSDRTVFTRLNNLTNNRYQDTYSYLADGFNASVGAEFWF